MISGDNKHPNPFVRRSRDVIQGDRTGSKSLLLTLLHPWAPHIWISPTSPAVSGGMSSGKDCCKCRDHRKTWERRILKTLNEVSLNYLLSPLARNWLEDDGERNLSKILLDGAKKRKDFFQIGVQNHSESLGCFGAPGFDIQTKKMAIRGKKIHPSSPILPPAAFSHQKKTCFIELFNNVMTIPAPAAASG